jgi:hypothetical protein
MTIRDIVEKLMGDYRNTPKTPEGLQRERDRRLLAGIDMGKPMSKYFASEDRNMSIANYKYEYAPMEIKKMNMRLSRLPDEEYKD